MVKKSSMLLIIFVLAALFSMPVFAGNTEGTGIAGTTGTGSLTGTIGNTSNAGTRITSNAGTGLATGAATGAGEGALGKTDEAPVEEDVLDEAAVKLALFNEALAKALKEGQALNTGEVIMTITRPDMDKYSTYKKTYIISGNSEHKDVVISIARLNRSKKEYEIIANTNGETSWGIGASRIFSKEIDLEAGVNNLMFVSYRKSEMEESKIQYNSVTISLQEELVRDAALKKEPSIMQDPVVKEEPVLKEEPVVKKPSNIFDGFRAFVSEISSGKSK